MKYNYLIIAITILFLGCENNEEKSDAFGNFEADPVIVSSESSGKVFQLNVEKGQKIDEGFVAAVIDSTQLHLKLKQLEAQQKAVQSKRQSIRAQIDVLKQQKENLLDDKQRVEDMLQDGAATKKQLDDITGQIAVIDRQIESTQTQFTSVNSELNVLKTQMASTRDLIDRCTVESPANGTVLETYIEQGELAGPGKPLFKVADMDDLILKVYVSGAQLPDVKIGKQVEVLVDKNANENQSFAGEVVWISSEAEFTPKIIQTKEERVKLVYAVKVKVQNDGTLKIGMPGEINISRSDQSQ
ncbi:HlyD family secretion protein [Tangfeifania diversioriginum]|uniref:HlyD family secretion protein n=1 Tax=Tangfeifania diversioriginum TaxID=1168035 RepID=A0A1M6ETE1_9BACT|nr:HlyD family efflux transporter periplasmic adaptor subunit [Tangfeifania diversioriginum]SHI88678.1 HlyD family secretion protein [Tangfeifania diversioriginum]